MELATQLREAIGGRQPAGKTLPALPTIAAILRNDPRRVKLRPTDVIRLLPNQPYKMSPGGLPLRDLPYNDTLINAVGLILLQDWPEMAQPHLARLDEPQKLSLLRYRNFGPVAIQAILSSCDGINLDRIRSVISGRCPYRDMANEMERQTCIVLNSWVNGRRTTPEQAREIQNNALPAYQNYLANRDRPPPDPEQLRLERIRQRELELNPAAAQIFVEEDRRRELEQLEEKDRIVAEELARREAANERYRLAQQRAALREERSRHYRVRYRARSPSPDPDDSDDDAIAERERRRDIRREQERLDRIAAAAEEAARLEYVPFPRSLDGIRIIDHRRPDRRFDAPVRRGSPPRAVAPPRSPLNPRKFIRALSAGKAKTFADDMCPICSEKLSDPGPDGSSQLVMLACCPTERGAHAFHEGCLVPWIEYADSVHRREVTCPICRCPLQLR